MKKNKNFNSVIDSIIMIVLILLILNIRNISNFNLESIITPKKLLIVILLLLLYCFKSKIKFKYKKMWIFINLYLLLLSIFMSLFPSLNIFAYGIIYIYLLIINFFINYYTNKNFEVNLGITISLLLVILLILAIFNILKYSLFIILFLSFILIIYTIKKNQNIVTRFNEYLDKSVCVFSILFIIAIINGFERYVFYWDEYNMWALSAKKIIYTSSIKEFSYPPIIPLWHYFISLFDEFKEPNLYIGNTLLILSFLQIIISKINIKRNYFICAISLIAFSYLFDGVYTFNNLYADFPMAAIAVFTIIFNENYNKNKKDKFIYLLLLIIVTLCKPQGFVLSSCIVALFLLKDAFNLVWKPKINIIFTNIKILIKKYYMIFIPIMIYVLWKLFSSKILSRNIFISYNYSPAGLAKTFIQNPNFNDLLKFMYNITKFWDTIIINGIFNISLFGYFILSNLIIFYLNYSISKNVKKSIANTMPFVIIFIIYYLLTALSLLVSMPINDALNLASFLRYLDSYYLALFGYILYKIFTIKNNEKFLNASCITTLIIIMSVSFTNMFSFILDIDKRYENRTVMYNILEKYRIVYENTKANDKIFIIDQEDKGGYLPQCQSLYYLYPRTTSANAQINWRIATKSRNDGWEMDIDGLEKNLLKNKFDYLFLYSTTDEMYDELKQLYQDERKIENYHLFKIIRNNSKIVLQPVK